MARMAAAMHHLLCKLRQISIEEDFLVKLLQLGASKEIFKTHLVHNLNNPSQALASLAPQLNNPDQALASLALQLNNPNQAPVFLAPQPSHLKPKPSPACLVRKQQVQPTCLHKLPHTKVKVRQLLINLSKHFNLLLKVLLASAAVPKCRISPHTLVHLGKGSPPFQLVLLLVVLQCRSVEWLGMPNTFSRTTLLTMTRMFRAALRSFTMNAKAANVIRITQR